MDRITVPREISYGAGALRSLRYIDCERALIITDATLRRLRWAEKVERIFQDNGVETRVFSEVEPDPSTANCDQGAEVARQFEPDLIVGLGGGSAMDAGKAVWVLYEYPEATWDWIFSRPRLTNLRQRARYVAIPTTSGTGSEVTFFAVITDHRSTPPVKRGFGSREMAPDVAIVDPELTVTMPPSVTADTGFDVLVHAVEAYVSVAANDFSDPLALQAIKTVFTWLPRAVAHGDDLKAREKMHFASTTAGIGFTNADLGLVHALAHQLGAVFGVPHGRANALMLAPVVRYNAPVAKERYAEIARAIGLQVEKDEEATAILAEAIVDLQEKVGIPTTLRELGLEQSEFLLQLEAMAENAYLDGCRPGNPRPAEEEDLKELLLGAWR
ncbi:MAG: iron-containing alcohol dehydrogenase [Anaerolineae bacterium]